METDKTILDIEKKVLVHQYRLIHSSSRRAVDTIVIPCLIVFVVLKLTDVISWSWWWVISPFWIGLIVNILVSIVLYIKIRSAIKKIK